VIEALRLTHREDLIPLLVPTEGRRAVQRAKKGPEPQIAIHPDGRYTVQPDGGRRPAGNARFAPHGRTKKPEKPGQKWNDKKGK
jgi:hypothetical protein